MSQTPTIPPIVNKTMKLVLNSPLHGMVSKTILLISFTGRKSGRVFTTPVSYSQQDDQVFIFTHADWWKNLRQDQPVTLHMRGNDYQGFPETIAGDKQAVSAGLAAHLRRVPSDARYYAVTFDTDGNPRPEDVDKAVQSVVMIRIRLC